MTAKIDVKEFLTLGASDLVSKNWSNAKICFVGICSG